eukprot:2007486-Prymnesium_polylepis.1
MPESPRGNPAVHMYYDAGKRAHETRIQRSAVLLGEVHRKVSELDDEDLEIMQKGLSTAITPKKTSYRNLDSYYVECKEHVELQGL